MDRPEKRAVAGLPDDPLVEILSRVSVKDLYRSKCVSKAWCSLIADPVHRKKLPQTLEGFFFGGTKEHRRYIDLMNRSVPLVDPSFSFLDKLPPGIENLRLMCSCNGLLLFEHGWQFRDRDTSGYVVCNPATKQLMAVPPSPLGESMDDGRWLRNYTFLMFDPAVSSHFHLICIWSSPFRPLPPVEAMQTFSSETGVWSDRLSEWRGQWGEYTPILLFFRGTVFNNMLHFVIFLPGSGGRIVAIDGKGKTCRIIPFQEEYIFPEFVGQFQGRLCIIVKKFDELSIWVLEAYDKEEWSLKHSVSFLKLFGQVTSVHGTGYSVVTIHPGRNLVFFADHQNGKLISYDMDSKEVHALCTLGQNNESVTPYVPYFSELPMLTNNN